mmetsp:Transcript_71431/g.232111  ORF Transcript_71431/g.232111 Transcript_71431/m.232111 type:complete len:229 (-) Transcript_71431:795-1481(-)
MHDRRRAFRSHPANGQVFGGRHCARPLADVAGCQLLAQSWGGTPRLEVTELPVREAGQRPPQVDRLWFQPALDAGGHTDEGLRGNVVVHGSGGLALPCGLLFAVRPLEPRRADLHPADRADAIQRARARADPRNQGWKLDEEKNRQLGRSLVGSEGVRGEIVDGRPAGENDRPRCPHSSFHHGRQPEQPGPSCNRGPAGDCGRPRWLLEGLESAPSGHGGDGVVPFQR